MRNMLYVATLTGMMLLFLMAGLQCGDKPMIRSYSMEEAAKVAFLKYEPGLLAKLKASKTPAFIHLTGDACLLCKVEWAQVDKAKLFKAALDKGYVLYEYNIDGKWGEVLKEMVPHKVFGVPGYVIIDKEGNVKALESVGSEDDIIKEMK